jgi:hypothetical protein
MSSLPIGAPDGYLATIVAEHDSVSWNRWPRVCWPRCRRSRTRANVAAGGTDSPLPDHGERQPAEIGPAVAVPAWKDVPIGHTQIARAHGRIEEAKAQNRYRRRRNPVPARRSAIQVVRRTRRRGTKKTWQNETVYAITSLPAEQAQPRDLAHWIRSH